MPEAISAYELVEKGLYKDAAAAIDRTANIGRDLLILRARLESHIGNPNLTLSVCYGRLSIHVSVRLALK